MLWIILVLAFTGVCSGQRYRSQMVFNCTGIQGVAWWACRSFGTCNNNVYDQQDCVDGTVYDQQSSCVNRNSAPFPCNLDYTDVCKQFSNDIYVFAEKGSDSRFTAPCQFFYTCNYGSFVGHQRCPGETVFNEFDGNCQKPEEVPSPCGTADFYKDNTNFY